MKKTLIAQLKRLKDTREGGSPDERWLASTRESLLMQIRNTVDTDAKKTGLRSFQEFVSVFRPENLTRAIATPLAVVLLMFGTWMTGTAVTDAARDTLPGQTLYSMKLLGEELSLRFSSKDEIAERRLDIASRRLEEMTALATSADAQKTEKMAALSERFAQQMDAVRDELDVSKSTDSEKAVQLALRVDAATDEYQAAFATRNLSERSDLRMALLSLDRTSVKALEVLVDARTAVADRIPEAQLSANVQQSINTFASRVASAEGALGGDASVPESRIELTVKAKSAVEEAKASFAEGDFKAAVRKVIEGTELVNQAETATDPAMVETPEPAATSTETVAPADDTEDAEAVTDQPVDTSADEGSESPLQ